MNRAGLVLLVLTLAWQNNAMNSTSIAVERLRPNGRWARIATLPSTATTYTDTSVATGKRGCYRVFAVNPVWESPPSNVACGIAQ